MIPLPDIGPDYVVQRHWRSSGEAELFFAQHLRGGRHVVKLPHRVEEVRPWLAWAERQRHLHHPRILQVRDAGIATDPPGRPFMVTEHFVWETTLRDLLRQHGVLTAGLVRQIVLAILEALVYAHAHSPPVVHRDLKPENVLLTTRGPELQELKLIDFSPDRISGTPPYRAPELGLPGAEPGPATDVFALGVIAYELLTGRPPVLPGAWDAQTARAALHNVDYGQPALRPWEAFLRGCLDPERQRRFADAPTAMAALRARPAVAAAQPGIGSRRRLALSLIGAMAGVALLMLLAVVLAGRDSGSGRMSRQGAGDGPGVSAPSAAREESRPVDPARFGETGDRAQLGGGSASERPGSGGVEETSTLSAEDWQQLRIRQSEERAAEAERQAAEARRQAAEAERRAAEARRRAAIEEEARREAVESRRLAQAQQEFQDGVADVQAYLDRGLWQTAEALLATLERDHPGRRELRSLRETLESRRGGATEAAARERAEAERAQAIEMRRQTLIPVLRHLPGERPSPGCFNTSLVLQVNLPEPRGPFYILAGEDRSGEYRPLLVRRVEGAGNRQYPVFSSKGRQNDTTAFKESFQSWSRTLRQAGTVTFFLLYKEEYALIGRPREGDTVGGALYERLKQMPSQTRGYEWPPGSGC